MSRRQAYAAGLTRSQVRAQLAAERWQVSGRQTVAVHTGDLSQLGTWWRAVLEVGPTAALDGITALIAAGLQGFTEERLHVSIAKSKRPRHPAGVVVHETRRFREGDVVQHGVRRMTPGVAAVHAALWAVSDRQATLLLAMAVQQKLVTGTEVSAAVDGVGRHRRRTLLRQAVGDITSGSESLGELDVLSGLRRRALPEPTRQAVRRLSSGRAYLDMEWEPWRLVLEIDGAQHDEPLRRLTDTLRDLEVAAGGRTVLRIPLTAWRLDEEAVLDRLVEVFRSRGWSSAA